MKQYYYQNNYGVIACRKVCSCAPILNVFCGPPKFFHRGKFIFRDFCGCRPTFLSHNGEIWYDDADLGLPPPSQIWLKKHLRGYTPFEQMYTKNTNFGNFGGCRPTFLNSQWWNLAWGCKTGSSLQPKFGINRLRGYTPFGQIYTKNDQFWRFWGL